LILVAVVFTPVLRTLLPAGSDLMAFLWPVLLGMSLALRARHRQQHETASDLRALALTGNAEALIRALTKLHDLSRIPRRWTAEVERRATHPSLAHRIRAIREAAGTPPVSLETAVTLATPDGSSSVTFLGDRLEWREAPGAIHILNYGRLSELRLDAGSGGTGLVAVDAAGHRWRLPLASADVARAQAVMDQVDSRLANPIAAPAFSPAFARILALLTLLTAVSLRQYALALAAALAIVQPVSPLISGAGVAAAAAAALTWRNLPLASPNGGQQSAAVLMLLCGLILIAFARMYREQQLSAGTRRAVGALASCVALVWVSAALAGLHVVKLHQAARDWPATAVLPLALAGALVWWPTRMARRAAALVALAGVGIAGLGSTGFLEAFGGDPFLARAPSLTFRTMSNDPFLEFPTGLDVMDVRISPQGRAIALVTENDDEETSFHVGGAGMPLTRLDGADAIFVDDDHLLLLERESDATVLREVKVGGAPVIVWQQKLEGLLSSSLAFNRGRTGWTVVGRNRARQIVRASGRIGSDTVDEQRWTLSSPDRRGGYPIAVSGPDVVMLEKRYERSVFDGTVLSRWRWMLLPVPTTRFWMIGPAGEVDLLQTQLDLRCGPMVSDDDQPVCAAFDGTRTRLFALDGRRRRVEPLVSVPERFTLYGRSGRGWLQGWVQNTPIVLRLSTREAIRAASSGSSRVQQVGATDDVVATVSRDSESSTVRLYRVE